MVYVALVCDHCLQFVSAAETADCYKDVCLNKSRFLAAIVGEAITNLNSGVG
jgi:hypothetical protein